MTPPGHADIVVLDAHGVVFNRVFPGFVRRRALERGDDPDEVWDRWRKELRMRFWKGRTTPREMWGSLFPGDNAARLSAELERLYEPGPLYRFAATGECRLWLLSNHRTGWLLPRLERFDLGARFENVLVSDRIGAVKPHPRAFAPIVEAMGRSSVVFYDDSAVNVAAACAIGIDARHVSGDGPVPEGLGYLCDGSPTDRVLPSERPRLPELERDVTPRGDAEMASPGPAQQPRSTCDRLG